MTINATASVLLCLYIASGQAPRRGPGPAERDAAETTSSRNTSPGALTPTRRGSSMRLVVDVFKYCAEHIPRWNTISISGYHMREAGATAVQELAFTFANAIGYVQAAVDAGLAVDDFAPRLSFFFVAQNNLLEEVAKYRAARRMWATSYAGRAIRGQRPSFPHAALSHPDRRRHPDSSAAGQQRYSQQRCRPWRLFWAAPSPSMSIQGTRPWGLPTEESAQLSLRTQQIIAHESGVADVVDPLGGSWYVESLTDQLEHRAQEYIGEIDRAGRGRGRHRAGLSGAGNRGIGLPPPAGSGHGRPDRGGGQPVHDGRSSFGQPAASGPGGGPPAGRTPGPAAAGSAQ